MGYICHHAIVVTGWGDRIKAAHAKAKELQPCVSELVEGINNYSTFLVAPDGSKEGWEDSDKGDASRDAFVAWLRLQWEDGSPWLSWAEIEMDRDADEPAATVTRHAWEGR